MAARNFDTNTARTPSFFDATTYFYGWKNSESNPDKDFKVLYDDLYNTIRGGFTAGSVLFASSAGRLNQDNSNLFYDDTLNYLGIGTNAPSAKLSVYDTTEKHLLDVATDGYYANRRSDITTRARFMWWKKNVSTADTASIFFGFGAGNNSSGNRNVGIGGNALAAYTGQSNVAIGAGALEAATTGDQQTAVGDDALGVVTTGSANTALGYRAGFAVSTGTRNTLLGWGAGNTITTQTDATAIGYNAQIGAAFNYSIALGSGATTTAANQLMIGGAGLSSFITEAVLGGTDQSGVTAHTTTLRTADVATGTSNQTAYNIRNLRFAGARGTGTGNGGNIDFSVAPSGASGSAKNTYLRTFQVVGDGAGIRVFQKSTPIVPNTGTGETLPADSFGFFSNDVAGAGTASPHFITEDGATIKLYQMTTAVASATFVANAGTAVNENSTFDGYTIAQMAKILRNLQVAQ